MKKKLLCSILTTALLFSAFPTAVIAADSLLPLTTSIDLREKNQDDYGPGWYWDADSLILTLENFGMTVPYDKLQEKAAIYLPDESMIYLEGENELQTNAYHCDAIYAEGELYVSGDGTLKITTNSLSASAFFVKQGSLIFDEEVEVNIDSAGYVIYLQDVRGQEPVLSVKDDAKVTFPQECTDRNILLTKKSSVHTYDNWLNYKESLDDVNKTVVLTEKTALAEDTTEDPAENLPEETLPAVPALNEYQITINSPAIVKNGEVSYTADVAPYLKNGYTMLPLRALLEVSNPEQLVNWNNGTKSAHTFVNNRLVSIKPGETTYTKALETIELYTPAETVNGRLFVSLRDWMSIMEIDSSQLKWDPATKTVTLTY